MAEEDPCYPNTNYYVDDKGVLHIDGVKGYRMVTEYIRDRIRPIIEEIDRENEAKYAAMYKAAFGAEEKI